MVFVGTTFMGCVEICILIQWVSCIRVGKASHGLDSMLTGLALWMLLKVMLNVKRNCRAVCIMKKLSMHHSSKEACN